MSLFRNNVAFFLGVVVVGFLATSCLRPDSIEAGPTETGPEATAGDTTGSVPNPGPTADVPTTSSSPAAPNSSEPKAPAAPKPNPNEKNVNEPSDGCASNGSGGPTASVVQDFTDSTGTSSSYRLHPPNSGGASGLLVYLHGDGAYSYNNPGSMKAMRDVAAKHNLTMIEPLVPNGSSKSWWQKPDNNGTWLRELVENVAYDQYQIDKSRVVLSGFSGGTDFLSRYFISGHWDILPCGGGAVLMGGGGQPFNVKSDGFSAAFKDGLNLHYYTGLQDNGVVSAQCDSTYDALETSRSGAEYYAGQGFTVSASNPTGIDHCNVDQAKIVDQQVSGTLLS